MACYVRIAEGEDANEVIEVPTEEDGTLMLSSVSAQFPGSVGLRFRTESGAWRGLRIEGNIIDPPLEGWESAECYVVIKRAVKRGAGDYTTGPLAKLNKMSEEEILSDLFIAGLPYDATDDEIRDHFESFGELDMFDIKHDTGRGREGNKGFGFIRYKTVDAVEAALTGTHIIKNKRCELKFSETFQEGKRGYKEEKHNIPTRLFIGRIPRGTTTADVQEHFSQYGVLKDVYIPSPFKGYGFVVFESQEVASKVINDTHMFKGNVLNISLPVEKMKGGMSSQPNQVNGNMQGGGFHNMSGGMSGNMPDGMNMNSQPWMQGNMSNMSGGGMNTLPMMLEKMQNMAGGMNAPSWMQGKMQNNMSGGGSGSGKSMMQGKMQTQNGGSKFGPHFGSGYQGNGNYTWPVSN